MTAGVAPPRTTVPAAAGDDDRDPDEVAGAPRRPEDDPGDRLAPQDLRRLRRAWAAGAVPVLVVFTWLLMVGEWAPLQRQFFDDFFDAQGRAFLDGRWDVPTEVVGFEGFDVDGRTHIYFGPWPALLRVPVLLVTDRLDGRLTTLSMMLAMVLLAVGAHRLNLVVRRAVRGPVPVSTREAVATAALAVAALSGPPLWLGSAAIVYHEAILWGVAFTVAALATLAAWVLQPTRGRLAAATALAVGASASRFTLGAGLLIAMAVVAGVAGVQRVAARRRGGTTEPLSGFPLRWIALACTVILALAAVPNLARFGTLVSPPMDRQLGSAMFDQRQEFLAANHGAFFGLQFLPTTALTYLRPDGFDARVTFPWVDFPRAGPSVVGETTFDDLVWTSSVPAAMPAMCVLAIPGIIWLVRAVRRRRPSGWLAAVAVGALGATGGVLTIGHVSNRYLNDFVPLVMLLGLVGAHALAGRLPTWNRARRRLVTGVLGALVVVGMWASFGLGLVSQRERAPVVPEEWREQLFRWRLDLPGGRPPIMRIGESVWAKMPKAGDGTVAILGDCLGVYVRVGRSWEAVSRGPGAGVYDLRVDLDALADIPEWSRAPVMVFEDGGEPGVVALKRLPDGRVRVDVKTDRSPEWHFGYTTTLEGEVPIRVALDAHTGHRLVTSGQTVLYDRRIASPDADPTIGAAPDEVDVPTLLDRYPGEIRRVGYDDDLCRDLKGSD